MSYTLKLLLPDFNKNTLLEKLPYEIIEYIISKFIILPINKSIINSKTFILKNIFQRFYYIWKNYYKLYIKLNVLNITDYHISYNDLIIKCVHDPDYILNTLKYCNCCENNNNSQTFSLYECHHNNSCSCPCLIIIRCLINCKKNSNLRNYIYV